jgi:hypothetical protein
MVKEVNTLTSLEVQQALFSYGNFYKIDTPDIDLTTAVEDANNATYDPWMSLKVGDTNPRFYKDITTNRDFDRVGDLTTFCKNKGIRVVPEDYGYLTRLGHDIFQNSGFVSLVLGKSTLVRMDRGAFFSTHRDKTRSDHSMFRVICPLKNATGMNTCFMMENQRLDFESGKFYVFNSARLHSLFHMDREPAYWILLNVLACEQSLKFIESRLEYV